ncbi:PRC-barrel domain-containing protein [Kitasatospora nipponensis]|uniref:PRC-barrel domain-containing protein n=1 Tax=Kitasatospora nipponensis TaxID=258049 RepID=UPI003CD07032
MTSRELRRHDVADHGGREIGTLKSVPVDTATAQPSLATVTVGLPTRHRPVFVPLAGARVGPGCPQLAHPRSQVERAPAIGTDGEQPAEDEAADFTHHGPGPPAGCER